MKMTPIIQLLQHLRKDSAIGLLLLFLVPAITIAQGHEIKFKINGLQDTTVILGHRFNSTLIPDDTTTVGKNGTGTFKGDKAYPGGMYFFVIKGKLCEFLLDKDQEFYLETDTANLQGNLVFKGSELNDTWIGFHKKIGEITGKRDALVIEKAETPENRKKEIDEEIKRLGEEFMDYKWRIIEENKDNLVGVFLKATEEIKVPDFPRDENGNVTDSLFQYKYYRSHFFDNFDISDPRLLRTPIYDEKINRYIDKVVVPPIPDTLIKEVDFLIEKARTNEELFRYMLVTLFKKYAESDIMGMDAVFLHIAQKYYIPEATWSSEKYINELKETVQKQIPLTLGKVAPNIQLVHVPSEHFKLALNDTAAKRNVYVGNFFNIHDIKADYIVLYFWEADCGHCKKSSPKLHAMVNDLKKMNTVVVAVHMMGGYEGKVEWVDFINKNKMYDWINAWNPYSLEYKDKFDLKATNQIFILDKDKKIVAKRISPEQVADVIKTYNEREKRDIK